MEEQELKIQSDRIFKYRELEKTRDEMQAALNAVTEPWPETGPHGQGPFTGNTRESRQVESMHISFSATRGGAAPVSLEIKGMHIEAFGLGKYLQNILESKIDLFNEAMEKI